MNEFDSERARDTDEFPAPGETAATDEAASEEAAQEQQAEELADQAQEHQERTAGDDQTKYDGGEIPRNGDESTESAPEEPAADSEPVVVEEPSTEPPVE